LHIAHHAQVESVKNSSYGAQAMGITDVFYSTVSTKLSRAQHFHPWILSFYY